MKTTIDTKMPQMQRVEFAGALAPVRGGVLVPAPPGGAAWPRSDDRADMPESIELVRLYNGLLEAAGRDNAVVQFAGAAEEAGAADLAYRAAWTGAAMLGKRVLFVDAWTGAGQAFTPPVIVPAKCLRQVALGQARMDEAIVRVADTGLHVAVLQDDENDPAASVLPAVRTLLESLRASFDMVVLASAPALRQPLAAILGSVVDGSVLVVEAGRSRAGAAARAAKLLGGGKVLGVVVNRQRDPLPAWLRKWL